MLNIFSTSLCIDTQLRILWLLLFIFKYGKIKILILSNSRVCVSKWTPNYEYFQKDQ